MHIHLLYLDEGRCRLRTSAKGDITPEIEFSCICADHTGLTADDIKTGNAALASDCANEKKSGSAAQVTIFGAAMLVAVAFL
ncbi:hypothetical protein HDU81_000697 [Chytriomyces hyalinus]|nr:hypothetical protein HDU81_000697 [Chytriomyces hyalinus]